MTTKPATKKSAPKELEETSSPIVQLEAAIKLLNSACENPEFFVITAGKSTTLTLSASNSGSEACYRVPCVIDGLESGSSVKVLASALASAIRGRKTGSLTLTENDITFKSGAYSYKLIASEADYVPELTLPEGVSRLPLSPELTAYLNKVLPTLRVEKVHSVLADAMLNVRLSPTEHYMACYDTLQVCYVDGPPETGLESLQFDLCIPYSRFVQLLKDMPRASVDLYVSEDSLFFVTPLMKARVLLPIVDPDAVIAPDDTYEGAKAASAEKPTSRVSVDLPQLRAFMDNSKDLLSGGTPVDFSPTKVGVKIVVQGIRGAAKFVLRDSTITEPFSVDSRVVMTMLSKCPAPKKGDTEVGQLRISIVQDGAALRAKLGGTKYIAGLLQPSNSGGSDAAS